MQDLDESLSGSDSDESEDDGESSSKDTTLTALLKKQANISGKIEDEEDPFTRKRKRGSGKAPIYWFTTPTLPTNTSLGIYRAIFTNEEQSKGSDIVDIVKSKQLAPKPAPKPVKESKDGGVPLPISYSGPHIFLCMIGGGHFAAMVVSLAPKQTKSGASGPLVREATVLAHKTFHRYTTRRKQGGSQSANDSAKGAAHSAGADLRRYNEQALVEDVRGLLQDWKGLIDTSELLFVRATGNTNRRTLFGPYENQPLKQNDPRIRTFPFSTRRATQSELMRSYVELTRVKVREVDEAAIAAAAAAAEEARQISQAKASKQPAPIAPKRSEEEETALLHTTQLQALIKRSKIPALLSYLKANELSPNFKFYPEDSQQNHHAPTILHLASSQNSPVLVSALLLKASADPTILNGDNKPAFDLAGDRATRDAFRVARSDLGESRWNWDTAHIPSPITKSEAEDRDKREKKEAEVEEETRRKAEEKRLKEEGPKVGDEPVPLGKAAGKGRLLALGAVKMSAEERRAEEGRGLSVEMRAKLERERRARAAEERMKKMQGGGAGG